MALTQAQRNSYCRSGVVSGSARKRNLSALAVPEIVRPELYSKLYGSAKKEPPAYKRLADTLKESLPCLPLMENGSYVPAFRKIIAPLIKLIQNAIENRRAIRMKQEAIEQERNDRLYLTHLRYALIHGKNHLASDDVKRITGICIAQKSEQALSLLNLGLRLDSDELALDIAKAVLKVSEVIPVSTSLHALKIASMKLSDYNLSTSFYDIYSEIRQVVQKDIVDSIAALDKAFDLAFESFEIKQAYHETHTSDAGSDADLLNHIKLGNWEQQLRACA